MNRKKFVLGVIGVLFAIALISSVFNLDFSPSPKVAVPPQEGSLAAIVEECRTSTEKNFPDHNIFEYDAKTKQLTIAVWIDDSDYAALYASIGTEGTLEAWNSLTADLVNACSSWQNRFNLAGYNDVTVVMHLLNPSDQSKALASAVDGELFFDAVAQRSIDSIITDQLIDGTPASQYLQNMQNVEDNSGG